MFSIPSAKISTQRTLEASGSRGCPGSGHWVEFVLYESKALSDAPFLGGESLAVLRAICHVFSRSRSCSRAALLAPGLLTVTMTKFN